MTTTAVADGLVVTLEYTVLLPDGVVLDSTGSCGPISVMHGSGQLFPALEDRIVGMQAGETRELRIPPEEGYGRWHPDLVRTMPRSALPPDLELTVGEDYRLKAEGKDIRFRLVEFSDTEVRADFNAPFAGKDLTATVTIVGVRTPTPEEDRRGRVG
jgi:FKBP-type peptidyl-prolyl cis-trans isomerase 2